jgi:hypothetical protein
MGPFGRLSIAHLSRSAITLTLIAITSPPAGQSRQNVLYVNGIMRFTLPQGSSHLIYSS